MEKQISIIIPTYNMEKYIGKCLDSLLIPEFDQVEVLVVNDGSKDRSSEIAHGYADRYPGSIRVIDKPNGNYGSCINAALPLATGRYVKVLDADDTFDTEAFSKFVRILPNMDDDAVVTNHIIVDDNDNVSAVTSFNSMCRDGQSMNIETASGSILSSYVQMHRIAYLREVFNRFSYHQTEGVSYTDSQWATVPMAYCKTVRYADLAVYRYLVGREGQTMSNEQIRKSLDNFYKVLNGLVSMYKDYTSNDHGKRMLMGFIVEVHEYVYFRTYGVRTPEAIRLLKDYDILLKDRCSEIYKAIAEIPLSEDTSFCLFEDMRKKNYPDDYNVPLFERVKLSLKLRMKNFVR